MINCRGSIGSIDTEGFDADVWLDDCRKCERHCHCCVDCGLGYGCCHDEFVCEPLEVIGTESLALDDEEWLEAMAGEERQA